MVGSPDQAQTLFLKFIAGFTPENIRDAIAQDIDMAELVREEYNDDILTEFRHYAKLYDITHPGAKEKMAADYQTAAVQVVEWLKINRPDLGFEVSTFQAYPTAASLGFSTQSGVTAPAVLQTEHVGIAWVKKNLQSLAILLL